MQTIISILCENTVVSARLLGEHGWSCVIERGNERYLFDTGQGMTITHNAEAMEISLRDIGSIFISHGHYDHTGGLKAALEQIGPSEIIAHPAVFDRHCTTKGVLPDKPRYIGCPFTQSELTTLGARLRFVNKTEEVMPGIWFVTGIRRNPEMAPNDSRLVLERNGQLVADLIEDDSNLLIETDKGPVLILGCAHSGIINILDFLRQEMGIDRLAAVLGGTHLAFTDLGLLPQVIERLESFNVDLVGASH